MALSILNNIASLAAQNQLSITNNNLKNTLFQLSSGQRINSGADDAAGLAIANGLQANITALTQSSQNATDGIGMLQVADGALSQVTSLLNRAVTLATESSTETVSDSQRTALEAEFSSIKSEIDNIGQKTTYNGSAVFTGGSTNYNQVTTNVAHPAGLASAITGDMKLKYWDTATGAYATGTFGASNGDATVGDLINDINGSGTGLAATLDKTGNIVVTDTQGRATGSTNKLVDNTSTLEVNGDSSDDTVANTTNASTLNVYLSDSTSAGSTTISVAMGALDSNTLNGISLANDNLSTAGGAQSALTDINAAIAQIASLRGNIGASSNQLTAATSVMNNQVQNLTSAEDGIMSADIPSEVANLTKYQILEQTGMSALAQANQMQQNVLKLLQ